MMHLKGIQNKHKVTIAWVLTMQCNAIKKKDMTGQSFIEQAPHTHSKRQTGLVLQHESSFKYFSLKYFLLKSITSLLRKG